jgi:hypothetical protein
MFLLFSCLITHKLCHSALPQFSVSRCQQCVDILTLLHDTPCQTCKPFGLYACPNANWLTSGCLVFCVSGLCVKGRISGLHSRYCFCICVRLRLLQEPYFSWRSCIYRFRIRLRGIPISMLAPTKIFSMASETMYWVVTMVWSSYTRVSVLFVEVYLTLSMRAVSKNRLFCSLSNVMSFECQDVSSKSYHFRYKSYLNGRWNDYFEDTQCFGATQHVTLYGTLRYPSNTISVD